MDYIYKYPRPAVTADCVVITKEKEPKVLLIQRGNPPFKGAWAFPGGFMNMDETTEECAIRELEEETSLKISGLHQIGAYSKVDRDPRGRTITVAYLAIIDAPVEVKGQDDAAKAAWFPIADLPHLAFDHFDIMHDAIKLYKSDNIQKMLQDAKAAELEKQRHQLYDPFYQRMNDQLYDVPTIEFTIVGIKQTCGEYSETIMKDIHAGSLLLLTPEPDNSYDKNAIAVYNEERKIGYVKATDTESIRPSVYDEGYTECYVVSKYKNSLVAECEEKEEDEDIDVDIPIIMPPEKPENDLEE